MLDKVPFGLVAVAFAWVTLGAQPDTRHPFSLYTFGYTTLANLWLLSGFGRALPSSLFGLLQGRRCIRADGGRLVRELIAETKEAVGD